MITPQSLEVIYGVLTWIGISFQSIVYYAIRSNVYGSKLNQEVNATTAFKIDRGHSCKVSYLDLAAMK
jgi:hypothetical protein